MQNRDSDERGHHKISHFGEKLSKDCFWILRHHAAVHTDNRGWEILDMCRHAICKMKGREVKIYHDSFLEA